MEFDKYKEYGAYHWKEYKQQTLYGQHANKIKDWIRPGKTLDIGAGDGLITHLIKSIGIDDNKIAVQLAIEKESNVSEGSAYDLQFNEKTFDNVLMSDVIEHLEFPDKALKEVKKVLKPDGYFYVVTPPAKTDSNSLWDKYHYREYKPQELIDYMDSNGFEIIGEVEVINKFVRMYAVFKLK